MYQVFKIKMRLFSLPNACVQRETGVWRGVNFPRSGPCAVLAMKAHVSRLGTRDV